MRALHKLRHGMTLAFVAAVCAGVLALADNGPGNPRPDVNVVGPTRDPADIRDEGLKQQNNPARAMRHWLENNKDDFDYYEPGLNTIIVDEGTEGRFIDKPDFLAVMDVSQPQGTVSISTSMENPDLGTITREYPAGTLHAAYAVFTGSQNVVSGITMTAMDGIITAMWRQVLDTNDLDAIYYSTTTNGGQNRSKPALLTNICKFDQPSATFQNQVTFRTNDFPWLANNGKNICAFFTERQGSCATGVPKVVTRYASDGSTWNSDGPVLVSDGPGAGFMPTAFGARGKVQVAWYDTRREEIPFTELQPYIADYLASSGSESVCVSRYRTVTRGSDPNGPRLGPDPVYEIEASFANAMMFKTGLLAFIGDYISFTSEEFRPRASGGWESNYSALPSPASNLIDFFVAYADHRDVRGDVLFGDGGMTKPYTPPVNVPSAAEAKDKDAPTPLDEDRVLVASGCTTTPWSVTS